MPRKQIDYKALSNRVVKSGKDFNAVMEKLIDMAGQEAEALGRGVMLDLYGELTNKAPKDTGRVTTGFNINQEPSEWVPPPGEYLSGLAGLSGEAAQKIEAIPRGRTITISNNVEYLPPLEDGHSRQAPSGFLAAAMHWAARRLEVVAAAFSKRRV
jgi:hypothetical protein